MQTTSNLYKTILAGNHTKEVKLDVYTSGGETLVYSFGMDKLTAMKSSRSLLAEDGFSVGSCVAGKLNATLYATDGNGNSVKIPKMARLIPRIRLVGENGNVSEWLQKGVYFIDTRESNDSTGLTALVAYDAMLKAEADYNVTQQTVSPISDINAVRLIAQQIGVEVDPRTVASMTSGYGVPTPVGYSCREVLSGIASAYGASFCISDSGKLLMLSLTDVPKPTRVLTDETNQYAITFGGVRIIV